MHDESDCVVLEESVDWKNEIDDHCLLNLVSNALEPRRAEVLIEGVEDETEERYAGPTEICVYKKEDDSCVEEGGDKDTIFV